MKSKRFPRYLESHPRQVFRLMVAVAAASLLAILVLAGFGIHYVYSRQIIANAEDDAVQTSRALLALERERIVAAGSERIDLPESELDHLDASLRRFLGPFDIVKIKIYDAAGRVAYSTDRAIIGQLDADNPRLRQALTGANVSELELRGKVLDLESESNIEVDVVETYVPIRNGRGEVIGSFEIYRDISRQRAEIFQALVQSILVLALILVPVFSGALALVKVGTDQILLAQNQLRERASRDPLTGILNRREIFERANHLVDRAERREASAGKESLGVIMLDVDHFKAINDRHGHAAGDHVLREIALRIEGTIRRSDFVGRYGGEEFLVLMPCASFAETRTLAERIRGAIRDVPFFFAGQSWQITASLGIAITGDGPQRFGLALERADEGLYLAKHGGRDRVAWVEAACGQEPADPGTNTSDSAPA